MSDDATTAENDAEDPTPRSPDEVPDGAADGIDPDAPARSLFDDGDAVEPNEPA